MDSEKEKFGDIIKTLSPSSIEDELNKTKRHSQVTCTYIYTYIIHNINSVYHLITHPLRISYQKQISDEA